MNMDMTNNIVMSIAPQVISKQRINELVSTSVFQYILKEVALEFTQFKFNKFLRLTIDAMVKVIIEGENTLDSELLAEYLMSVFIQNESRFTTVLSEFAYSHRAVLVETEDTKKQIMTLVRSEMFQEMLGKIAIQFTQAKLNHFLRFNIDAIVREIGGEKLFQKEDGDKFLMEYLVCVFIENSR